MLPILLSSGGPLVWLLLLVGAIATAVFAERLLSYHRAQINSTEFLNGVRNVLKRDNVVEAISICESTPGPVARLVKVAIFNRDKTRERLQSVLQEAGELEVPPLEQRLTILATGMYGKSLPNVDGAPIRLVVPWKYGFKSIKAIIKIELTDKQPETFWNDISSNEYGFCSNVNPNVDHPRWSQATERRIGEISRRPTLMFNGYYDEVASLYTGMDLRNNY